jgi:hypothetical protein
MTRQDDERLEKLLREALPPLMQRKLEIDLWPRMRRRLDEETPAISWLDWSLAAVSLLWLAVFPEAIPALLYHL